MRALCDARGAALILDDVRAGTLLLRRRQLGAAGRAARSLSAWSKAIANGHALAAVAGTDALRDAATRILSTGSFWAGG